MSERDRYRTPGELDGIRSMALGVGAVGFIAWLVGVYLDPEQGLRSWLLGFVLWSGIGFGAIGLLILQYLTGGAWGVVIRRTLEAASRTLPLILVLFLPLAIGIAAGQPGYGAVAAMGALSGVIGDTADAYRLRIVNIAVPQLFGAIGVTIGSLAFVTNRGVALPPGKHRLTIEADGYLPWDGEVDAGENGGLIKLDVKLVKRPD